MATCLHSPNASKSLGSPIILLPVPCFQGPVLVGTNLEYPTRPAVVAQLGSRHNLAPGKVAQILMSIFPALNRSASTIDCSLDALYIPLKKISVTVFTSLQSFNIIVVDGVHVEEQKQRE